MQKKHLIGYPTATLVAVGIGAAASSRGNNTVAAPKPGVTVTRTAPGPTQFSTVKVTAGPTVTVTAAPPPPKPAMPGDGTYEVGVDVKPGRYISTAADSGNCYWARLSGSNTGSDILDNGNSAGQVVVTIAASDKFFQSAGCNDWVRR